MKFILRSLIAVLVISVTLSSCKKDKKTTPGNNLPTVINNIITPAILDSLKKYGAVINPGTTPPALAGTYLLHPDVCSFDNSGGNFTGDTFDDYDYTFSKQNNANFTIRVDFTDTQEADEGTDSTSTFISGSGSLFTVFSQSSGVSSFSDGTTIHYVSLQILSGEITSAGIKNFQTTDYLQSKTGDTNGHFEPVGSTRIFYDSDGISELQPSTIVLPSFKLQSVQNTKTGGLSIWSTGKSTVEK